MEIRTDCGVLDTKELPAAYESCFCARCGCRIGWKHEISEDVIILCDGCAAVVSQDNDEDPMGGGVKMATYYMTCYRASERGYWERCNSRTLTGAKREATKAYGAGYIDSVLQIAVGDNITEPRLVIAEKSNMPGGKWKNID